MKLVSPPEPKLHLDPFSAAQCRIPQTSAVFSSLPEVSLLGVNWWDSPEIHESSLAWMYELGEGVKEKEEERATAEEEQMKM